MSNKYHFNKATGRVGQCLATKKGCPIGADTPHFENKEDAKSFAEKDASKGKYSFSTMSKKGIDDISALANLPGVNNTRYNYDDSYALKEYLNSAAPEFKVVEDALKVDYATEAIVEKDGHTYMIKGVNYWNELKINNAFEVVKQEKTQKDTKVLEVGQNIKDPELAKTFEELYNNPENETPGGLYISAAENDEDGKYSIDSSTYDFHKTYTRDDGSKIIVESISAPGDRSFTDTPNEINVPIEFNENGELQNARVMEKGLVIFDTKLNRGVALKHTAASEGGDDSLFIITNDGIEANTNDNRYWSINHSQMAYQIEGDGETTTPYYKII